MIENLDPNTIKDEDVRQVVITLMNLVETLSAKVQALTEENQRLRDENRRLKGEQGKPTFKPQKQALLLSSEQERHVSKPHQKAHKQAQIKIDQVEVRKVDTHLLPEDAQWKGYEDVIVQDIAFHTRNIMFRKESYYSASNKKTYLATLPTGYSGQFGPALKAWVLTLYYADGMSQPKILDLLHTVGLSISAGQLSGLLIKNQEPFHRESVAVQKAGLASSPWQHLDSTSTTVFGTLHQCHILCNSLYTAYTTLPGNDRMTLLRVLQGGADPLFQLSALAVKLFTQLNTSAKWLSLLPTLFLPDQIYTENQLDTVLDLHLPSQGDRLRRHIKEAMGIAIYRTQTTYPVVELLLCDDAAQFDHLTGQLALCWVHEYRHYKTLTPRFLAHLDLLKKFAKDFWTLYDDLLTYRDYPSAIEAERLQTDFDRIFGQTSGYQQLDKLLARTLAKKESLLMVLSHPEILLHNNPAELGARQRVRKRDVSLQACTLDGIRAWDTFQTLVETAKKLGVNLFQYFHDRISHLNVLPSLATLIQQRSLDLHLGDSWRFTT
jgi:regulator of replication initiation timing